ncbi:MAG: FG-GAP-like repeat-containing protein [Acidimicrobiales bacterium]|nr:FG-GAP-like repeat-containing protein [Acidimicrobiales bacterium]
MNAAATESTRGPVARIAVALVVVLAAGLLASSPASAAPTGFDCGSVGAAGMEPRAEGFFDRLNATRRDHGRSALAWNATLADHAREWSGHMADRWGLTHATTANGVPLHLDYVHQISTLVPNWRRAAENVGRGQSVSSVHSTFVGSSGHFQNMVGDFNQVGIGVVERGGQLWVTVRFVKGDRPAPVGSATPPSNFLQKVGNACVGDIPLSGDFDGNGVDDLLLYGPGRAGDGLVLNDRNGSTRRSLSINGVYDPFVADFDGDGRDDVMWYAAGSAPDFIWYGRADGTFTSRSFSVRGSYEPLVGDFDGNGRADIFWYAAGPNPDYFWYSRGRSFRSVNRNANGTYQPLIADYDGNGHDDIFWYAAGEAPDFLWYNHDRGVTSKSWSVRGRYQPVMGDYDGDGSSDIFWYAPGGAPDFIWYLEDRTISSYNRNVNGTYEVLMGDFDGTGTDDLFFFAAGSQADTTWLFDTRRGSTTARVGNISGPYAPVVGDFNGDRRSDIYWRLPGGNNDVRWFGR